MKRETGIFYLSTLLLVLFAYFIQTKTFFSTDVEYLAHVANQILAGGKYGYDIFETNPPMILYLYLPACLLAKWTATSIIITMRLYVFFLMLVSLGLSSFLLKKIIQPQDKILFYFLFYALALGILFPFFDFGQREHILIILMLPYLFSAVWAVENKSVHPSLAIVIGIMAGLGFALKPFFLVTPFLIELYIILKKRRLLAVLRIETVMIASVLVLYFISIFLLQPGYIKGVLPLLMRYYFPGAASPFSNIIGNMDVIFCITITISYLFYYQNDRYRALGWVIELALVGMIMAFLIPRTPWHYHVMPALSLAFLLVADFFGQSISFIQRTPSGLRFFTVDSLILLLAAMIILIVPVTNNYKIIKAVDQYQYKQVARKEIMNYINEHLGQHSIACIGLGTSICFPLVLYTHSEYAGRFPFFWWYMGLRDLEKNTHQPAVRVQLKKDKQFFIDSFAEDLTKYQARWIVIDVGNFHKIETQSFDIVRYLLENKKFKSVWQHYRYVATTQSVELYERVS